MDIMSYLFLYDICQDCRNLIEISELIKSYSNLGGDNALFKVPIPGLWVNVHYQVEVRWQFSIVSTCQACDRKERFFAINFIWHWLL